MDTTINFAKLHQYLDHYVAGLSHNEREGLETGKKGLKFQLVSLPTMPVSKKVNIAACPDTTRIIDRLKQFDSREDGYSYLISLRLNKEGYQQLLRHIDMPYTSRDNMRTMQTKLIEGTIGYRLRSHAILQA